MKKISVIIPSSKNNIRLVLALNAYLNQTLPADQFEIITILNGDNLSAYETCRSFENSLNMRIFAVNETGMSHSRNIGARLADGQYLLFADDDVLLCPDYLRTCLSEAQQRRDLVVRAPVYNLYAYSFFKDPITHEPYEEYRQMISRRSVLQNCVLTPDMIRENWPEVHKQCTKMNRFERIVYEVTEGRDSRTAPYRWLGYSGSGVMISKDLFFEAGCYDESFDSLWGCESIELGYRLMKGGVQFQNCPSIYSAHIDHPRAPQLLKMERSYRMFFEKHGDETINRFYELLTGRSDIREFFYGNTE